MNIDKEALKGIVDEIEASRVRQRGETEHQREVMKRAKAHQLDAKAIRIVLQRRAMGESKRDEQDYYVHSYELALGGKKAALEALEQGATVREAAKVGGISTGAAGNLAKAVQKSEIVDKDAAPQLDGMTEAKPQRPAPEGGEGTGTDSDTGIPVSAQACGGVESRHALAEGETRLKRARASVASDPEQGAGVAPGPQDLSSPKAPSLYQRMTGAFVDPCDKDDLEIPPFLRRSA